MAGSDSGFNAAEFRDAIHFAMQLGAAPDPAEQLKFYFPSTLVYTGPADGNEVPFDPATTVTSTPSAPVTVDCAVEYFDAENQPTSFGLLAPARIGVTLLDVDYAKVKGCSHVVIHGDRYNYRRTEPPAGLFDVGLYTLHFTSENET
jgi:hypothetical protein